jgi:hypothetical protein
MTDPGNVVRLDVALLKALTAKVAELEAQVAALRRDLAAVRRNAANDVLCLIVEAFQRLPKRVEAIIRQQRERP